jgi:hypothetical protein
MRPGAAARKGELKNEGYSHDVIENKYRKNGALLPCHDVIENT